MTFQSFDSPGPRASVDGCGAMRGARRSAARVGLDRCSGAVATRPRTALGRRPVRATALVDLRRLGAGSGGGCGAGSAAAAERIGRHCRPAADAGARGLRRGCRRRGRRSCPARRRSRAAGCADWLLAAGATNGSPPPFCDSMRGETPRKVRLLPRADPHRREVFVGDVGDADDVRRHGQHEVGARALPCCSLREEAADERQVAEERRLRVAVDLVAAE